MVEIDELKYGTIIEDSMGNRKKVVALGDDATTRKGQELLTTDSAGRPAIRCNNITGRGMSIVRKDMLSTYNLVSNGRPEWDV